MNGKVRKVIKTAVRVLLIAPVVVVLLFNMETRISDAGTVSTILEEYSDCYIYRYDYREFKLWSDPCNGRFGYTG